MGFQVLLPQSESTCAKVFFQFSMHDASGIHDISLHFNMKYDADIRKTLYVNFRPLSGTAMFQGTVECVTKDLTASAPSTMAICVVCSTNLNVVVMDFFSDVDREGVRPVSCPFIVHSSACVCDDI